MTDVTIIKELIGQRVVSCEAKKEGYHNEATSVRLDLDQLWFVTEDGSRFLFYHDQDCCEVVRIKDICGDLNDLCDVITVAEFVSKRTADRGEDGELWTFYKFATVKGAVTVTWVGDSNGYYSEEVHWKRLAAPLG